MSAKHKSRSFGIPSLLSVLLFSVFVSTVQAVPQSSSQQQSGGITVDPSAAPLKPSPEPPTQAPLPNAPQPVTPATPPQQPSSLPPAPASTQAPLGAAAAEQVRTAGGGASRPAGNAIAPAKQHQYRSLLIKIGAVAAAGIAAGAVYGLSRATSSTPPHSTTAAAK
jgi:hypothetical protein